MVNLVRGRECFVGLTICWPGIAHFLRKAPPLSRGWHTADWCRQSGSDTRSLTGSQSPLWTGKENNLSKPFPQIFLAMHWKNYKKVCIICPDLQGRWRNPKLNDKIKGGLFIFLEPDHKESAAFCSWIRIRINFFLMNSDPHLMWGSGSIYFIWQNNMKNIKIVLKLNSILSFFVW